MDDRATFLAAIEAHPLDNVVRCIYADWLDERGEVEEATRQREWVQAYHYLHKNFVNPYESDAEFGEPRTFEYGMAMIESWQRNIDAHSGICFDSDQALENLYDPQEQEAFYRSLEIVTGVKILPEAREQASFRCAC